MLLFDYRDSNRELSQNEPAAVPLREPDLQRTKFPIHLAMTQTVVSALPRGRGLMRVKYGVGVGGRLLRVSH
jgi:hypothetical protein